MIRLHFKINFYRIVEQKKFNAIIQWRLIRIQSKIGVQLQKKRYLLAIANPQPNEPDSEQNRIYESGRLR